MRNNLYKIQAATLGIAMALTLSCSSGEDDNGGGGGSCGSIKIGTQTWQKCNLNVVPSTGESACYDNNCAKYGRLYDWTAAMTACPSGWHLPSREEWDVLVNYVENKENCTYCAGKYLKAKNGWNDYNGKSGNGTDDYGFAALPGGEGSSSGYFYGIGDYGNWWSANDLYMILAHDMEMRYDSESAKLGSGYKSKFFSVRCLQDY